jgi:hypothetical protein
MQGNLKDEETPIDREIVNELVELTPEWWKAAVLDVSFSEKDGVARYEHVISSPEGQKEPIDPSAELLDATYRLGQVFRRHGRHWRNAGYSIHLQQDGKWKYTVDFGY